MARLIAFTWLPIAGLAQSHSIAGKAPELIEMGIPSFVVLGPEALGMATAPVDFKQMPDGRMLAMGHGELAFGDGVRWDVFRQADSDPRVETASVVVDHAGQIYAGIRGGFARIDFDQESRWRFVLQERLPAGLNPQTPALVSGAAVGDEWFWWGSGPIFAWHPGSSARLVGRTNATENVFMLGDAARLSDQSNGGLYRMENGAFRPVVLPDSTYVDETITCAVPQGDGGTLLGTISHGILVQRGTSVQPLDPGGMLGQEHRINDLCAVGGGIFAAALDNVGIVFFDRTGRVVQVLDRSVDHRFSRTKRLLAAPGGMVWALLNEGIARIGFPARVSNFEPLVSTGLAFSLPFRFEGRLWLLSDGRAHRAVYDRNNRLINFEVDTPGPYLTSLVDLAGDWIATTHDGIFRHEEPGRWTLLATGPVSPHMRPEPVTDNFWLYAAENEVGWLRRSGPHYEFERFPVPDLGHVYGAIPDARGIFWAELGNGRVARIAPTRPRPTVEVLGLAQGIPEGWAQLFNIDGEIRVNAQQQILKYDGPAHRFVPDTELVRRIPAMAGAVGRPAVDSRGRVWIATPSRVQVVDPRTATSDASLESIPEALHPLYFTPQSDGVVWMNERMRFARFDPSLPLPEQIPLHALITRIELPSSNRILYAVGGEIEPLPASDNSMVVHFLAPNSPFGQSVTFEVKLDGSTGGWVSAGSTGSITFNHLAPADYQLHVRPRIGSQPGLETGITFRILAPWYQTKTADVIYGLGAAAIVFLAAWLPFYFARLERARLKRLVDLRTGELNASNQQLGRQIHDSLEQAKALAVSEERYRRLSDNAPDIIFRLQVEPEVAFDYVSPAVTRITGYRPGEFTADPRFPQKIAHPPGSESIFEIAAAKQLPQGLRTLQWRTRDGRIVSIEERLTPVLDQAGRLIAIEGIARDITRSVEEQDRRSRLEAQLLQSQKLESVGTLAGGIAHDFNNILTGILGYCEMAVYSAGPDPALHDSLRQIRAAGLRAKDLVAQILTFSRKTESKLAAVSLAAVVGEALKLVRATTPATIEIVSDLSAGIVQADATQIHQLVINLCTNAIHAMRDNPGRLSLSVHRVEAAAGLMEEVPGMPSGPCLQLTVSDTGHGIDQATIARIFDPFFTTKQPGEGTGLGLSIVQGIVANHHAALRVRSRVGVGSVFEIFFPLSAEVEAGTGARASVPRGQQRNILVVDDEPLVKNFITAVLSRLDYRVTAFSDSREALAAVAAEPAAFQAVVTDLTMPNLTGLELIAHIRAWGVTVPVIIISGNTEGLGPAVAETMGPLLILAKPFDGDDLARALGRVLDDVPLTNGLGPGRP